MEEPAVATGRAGRHEPGAAATLEGALASPRAPHRRARGGGLPDKRQDGFCPPPMYFENYLPGETPVPPPPPGYHLGYMSPAVFDRLLEHLKRADEREPRADDRTIRPQNVREEVAGPTGSPRPFSGRPSGCGGGGGGRRPRAHLRDVYRDYPVLAAFLDELVSACGGDGRLGPRCPHHPPHEPQQVTFADRRLGGKRGLMHTPKRPFTR